MNNINKGKAKNMVNTSEGDVLQSKHPPQDTSYFILDPTNPDNLLGPMTKAELDLFYESRYTPTDIVDKAVFDPTSGLYYLLQNRCHNDKTALPTAIYHLMTGTAYCYDSQLK